MLAQNNNYFKKASATIYQLTQEELIRQQCLVREDYNRTTKWIENTFSLLKLSWLRKNHSNKPVAFPCPHTSGISSVIITHLLNFCNSRDLQQFKKLIDVSM